MTDTVPQPDDVDKPPAPVGEFFQLDARLEPYPWHATHGNVFGSSPLGGETQGGSESLILQRLERASCKASHHPQKRIMDHEERAPRQELYSAPTKLFSVEQQDSPTEGSLSPADPHSWRHFEDAFFSTSNQTLDRDFVPSRRAQSLNEISVRFPTNHSPPPPRASSWQTKRTSRRSFPDQPSEHSNRPVTMEDLQQWRSSSVLGTDAKWSNLLGRSSPRARSQERSKAMPQRPSSSPRKQPPKTPSTTTMAPAPRKANHTSVMTTASTEKPQDTLTGMDTLMQRTKGMDRLRRYQSLGDDRFLKAYWQQQPEEDREPMAPTRAGSEPSATSLGCHNTRLRRFQGLRIRNKNKEPQSSPSSTNHKKSGAIHQSRPEKSLSSPPQWPQFLSSLRRAAVRRKGTKANTSPEALPTNQPVDDTEDDASMSSVSTVTTPPLTLPSSRHGSSNKIVDDEPVYPPVSKRRTPAPLRSSWEDSLLPFVCDSGVKDEGSITANNWILAKLVEMASCGSHTTHRAWDQQEQLYRDYFTQKGHNHENEQDADDNVTAKTSSTSGMSSVTEDDDDDFGATPSSNPLEMCPLPLAPVWNCSS